MDDAFIRKPRYELLDGLRGVAALMVIYYHFFEAFATSAMDQKFNHGYLAVDFFFLLSGFVISYAYDDRWNKMSVGQFFKRRLIRLHPMVILGTVIGAVAFCIQGCEKWDGTHVGISAVMLAMLLNLFMLPAIPGTAPEIRGNGEMFPLNGPNWSLFFEYIGNIMYALFIHKLPTRWLKVMTAVCGGLLAAFAAGNFSGAWHIGVGWTLAGWNFPGGLIRMTFSYCAGMLVCRTMKPRRIKGAFLICSAALAALLAVPHLGGSHHFINGIYDSLCVMVAFPVILRVGACGDAGKGASAKACRFLGDISYPLYVVHYPLMYLYYSYVWKHGLGIRESIPLMAMTGAGSILLAWLALKLWDTPVRKRLSGR